MTASGTLALSSSDIKCSFNNSCFISDLSSTSDFSTMYETRIDAIWSNNLYFQVTSYYGSDQTNIYCPDNGLYGGVATCNIKCNGESNACDRMIIHAIEGMNDLIVQDNTDSPGDTFVDSTLHCGNEFEGSYSYSCDIIYNTNQDLYQCDNTTQDGSICQFYFIPTMDPTTAPTQAPTVTSGSN